MELVENFLILINSVSFYLLLGILLAAIIHEYIKEEQIVKHLGSKKISNIFKASLFGLPLPICSCGVIPLSASLKKQGASKGSVVSFLTTTPMTGVDSVLPTYAVFGWVITVFRVVSSLISGILGGIITDVLDKEAPKFTTTKPTEKESCCSNKACCGTKKDQNKLLKILDYGVNDLLTDIGKPLFIGIFLGAVFTTFFPSNLQEFVGENTLLSYLLVLLFAVPIYVCSVSSIPIAFSLVLAGFSPGAAFLFLSAAPATSLITVSVTYKFLGKKALSIYLTSIITTSLIFALLIDNFFLEYINIEKMISNEEEISIVDTISTIILVVLFLYTQVPRTSKET